MATRAYGEKCKENKAQGVNGIETHTECLEDCVDGVMNIRWGGHQPLKYDNASFHAVAKRGRPSPLPVVLHSLSKLLQDFFLLSLSRRPRNPIFEFWMVHGVERAIEVRPAANFDSKGSPNGIIHRQNLWNVPDCDSWV